jgi:hypothetical protein
MLIVVAYATRIPSFSTPMKQAGVTGAVRLRGAFVRNNWWHSWSPEKEPMIYKFDSIRKRPKLDRQELSQADPAGVLKLA